MNHNNYILYTHHTLIYMHKMSSHLISRSKVTSYYMHLLECDMYIIIIVRKEPPQKACQVEPHLPEASST